MEKSECVGDSGGLILGVTCNRNCTLSHRPCNAKEESSKIRKDLFLTKVTLLITGAAMCEAHPHQPEMCFSMENSICFEQQIYVSYL